MSRGHILVFFNRHCSTMNLVKEKQGGLVPRGLKRWPFKLIKHFADATGVSPSPAGPASFIYSSTHPLPDGVQVKHATNINYQTEECWIRKLWHRYVSSCQTSKKIAEIALNDTLNHYQSKQRVR